MSDVTDYPILLCVLSFGVLWLSARAGISLRARLGAPDEDWRDSFGVVRGAALTLLGLVVGFSFSMAISRYDQRKNLEEAEANAIGTEYVRADFLPGAERDRLRSQLLEYLDLRIALYTTGDAAAINALDARTARLQADLWATIQGPVAAQPTPIMGLVVAGLNDVLNSQGYTQAAWWNRIPTAAWSLMAGIAICCNLLVGFGTQKTSARASPRLLFILPAVTAISFMLIADLDALRHGIIRVTPQNLQSLAQTLPRP